ncbi:hypothetical protein [Candidatus Epulonipiscium viviparus]|uniref:hypothetical protein n=1 Tax=Candidatus Epulonipiscium viviparus TaxID=420336 RepID=UPI0027381454|nr:hypothetical protein [Candidatus Epulopiscium viviparus]
MMKTRQSALHITNRGSILIFVVIFGAIFGILVNAINIIDNRNLTNAGSVDINDKYWMEAHLSLMRDLVIGEINAKLANVQEQFSELTELDIYRTCRGCANKSVEIVYKGENEFIVEVSFDLRYISDKVEKYSGMVLMVNAKKKFTLNPYKTVRQIAEKLYLDIDYENETVYVQTRFDQY